SLVFSASILAALLLMPWPEGRGSPFFRAVELTLVDLATALNSALDDPRAFQSNLTVPQAGEENAGAAAQQAAAMLRARGVDRYELSSALANDGWAWVQIVATAWPRKREPGAR